MSARWLATVAALVVAAARPAVATAGSCSVTSVMPVAFGGYDVFDSAPVLSTGSISFECVDLAPTDTVRIDLDGGTARGFARVPSSVPGSRWPTTSTSTPPVAWSGVTAPAARPHTARSSPASASTR